MIEYHEDTHSFTYDDESSCEFPSIDLIKSDPYGDAVLRMMKQFKTRIRFSAMKFKGRFEFILEPNGIPNLNFSSYSLERIFNSLTEFAKHTCFYNRSLDEVRILLDMLEAGTEEVI